MANRKSSKNRIAYNRLTPEGWVFVTVLMFVTVGALLRNVNLLILIAGIMAVSLLLNWRFAVHRVRSLSISRRLSRYLSAGELLNIQWSCRNESKWMGVWDLVVSDQIERLPDDEQTIDFVAAYEKFRPSSLLVTAFGEVLERIQQSSNATLSKVNLGLPIIRPKQAEVQSFRTYFGQRGKYTIGPGMLSTTYPFGLIVSRVEAPEVITFFVGPKLGQLEPTWEKRLQSTAIGSDAVKRQRSIEEDEFYALRPWRSGDSKKNIHWRTTAKLNSPMIKQYDQHNNRDFALLADLYRDDERPETDLICERVISFTATAMRNISKDVQGQAALGICGEETDICCSKTAQGIILEANRRLAVTRPSSDPETIMTVSRITSLVSGETPIYVISSREKPDVFDAHKLDAALLAAEDSKTIRELKMLKQNLHLIRWLHVDSGEVKSIFKLEEDAEMQRRLGELARKIHPFETLEGLVDERHS
ncbi:MAG: DUF58 domain-containing protein [Planctomycetota bacterium]